MKTGRDSGSDEIVVDSYAWIEYFRGSAEGKKAERIIDGNFRLLTPAIVIAELSDKYRRSGASEEWENEKFVYIGIKSEIVKLDEDIADLAGKIKTEKRQVYPDFGLGDAVILATAKKLNARVLTGDKHLKTRRMRWI